MAKKIKLSIILSIFCILAINFSVYAEDTKEVAMVKMGNTSINAMEDTRMAYENGCIYVSLDGEDGYTLYKHTLATGVMEEVIQQNIYGLNIVDGVIYGYINYGEESEQKSGIYKIDTKEANKISLVLEVEDPSNILVVDDTIYFLIENEYGDISLAKVKVDGSDYSVYLEEQIIAFTVYNNQLYIMTDEGLSQVEDVNGEISYNNLGIDLDLMVYTSFAVTNDAAYVNAYGYEDNEEAGIYRVSLLEDKSIQLIPDTLEAYEFDVLEDAIVYVNEDNELIKIPLNSMVPETLYQSYDVFELASYEDSVYLLTYEYLNDNFNDELWYVDANGASEKRLYPESNKDYEKIKEILTNTSKVMTTVKRYDVKLEVVDDRVENEQVFTSSAKFRIDNGNDVFNETIKLQIDDEENEKPLIIKYNEWADDKSIYTSKDSDPWRLELYSEKTEPMYEDLFDLFKFIDSGSDYCSKLNLSENSFQYILQGESSFGRVLSEIENNYWLQFFMSGLSDLGTVDLKLIINKTSYRIEELIISYKEFDEDNNIARELSLEADSNYNLSNTLKVPSYVFDSILQLSKAYNYIEKAVKANEDERSDMAIRYCEEALELHEMAIHAYVQKALALIHKGEFDEAIEQLELFLDNVLFEETNDVYLLLADIYNYSYDYEIAREYLYQIDWDRMNPEDDLDAYIGHLITFSRTYTGLNDYNIALSYIEDALKLEEDNNSANLMKVGILFKANKQLDCIEFAEGLLEKEAFAKERTIFYYIGKANILLGNKEEALKAYKQALQCEENLISNSVVYFDLGLYYCWTGKYGVAQLYADKIDKDYKYATEYLNNLIEEGKKPVSYKVGNFVLDNYLYLNNSDISSIVDTFKENEEATLTDIDSFITNIKQPDDRFTFLLYGDSLKEEDMTEEVSYKQIDESTEYIKVSSFLNHTGVKFINFVEAIEKPYNKTLIIDLRGNGGGLISAATDMLDVLLPQCSPCYLVNRSGETTQIESDAYQVPFKAIKILVDNNSASSSELLALGLKKFLGNVEILGKTTYGKGVGQTIYADEKETFQLFLVSFYWNILQENIDGVGITPDVEVEGTELEDFLNVINSKESD